jgi:nucleotide-binding universal stress UspA family protein
MKKNRVLLPVDGSEFARQIYPHVIRYLPADENELILLEVAPPKAGHVGHPGKPVAADSDVVAFERRSDYVETIHPIYASQEWESAVADARQSLEKDVHLLEMAGYTVTSVVRMDRSPGTAILNYIETHDIDLLAMTTHGRAGLGRMLFGSVAQYLAQHLQIPMMIVRPTAEV